MKRLTVPVGERGEWLDACPLFAEMPSGHVAALAEISGLRLYESGEVLFHAGAAADGFHIVVEGLVKVCRYGPDGREQVLHMFAEGEPCGEAAVFEGGVFPATAEAVAASRTLFLPRDRFLALAAQHPELLLSMLAVLSRRLRRFVEMIDDLSLKEVSTRLARYVLDLSERNGGNAVVELDSTKAMLAARIGAVAETLSRTLARMQRKGVLEVDGRRFVLKDRRALERLAEGEKL